MGFDRFQRLQTEPATSLTRWGKIRTVVRHPLQTLRFMRAKNKTEGVFERIKMYNAIHRAMDPETRRAFKDLLKQGVLNDADTDFGRSTLYYLYAMLNTRRATGYDNKELVRETIKVLHRPYFINQKFAKPSEQASQKMLDAINNPGLNRAGVMPPMKRLQGQDLHITSSATCVASSVMYYMADKKPGELTRHLNELTSPMQAFFERAKLSEISPEDPRKAYDILRQQNIKYFVSGPGEVTLKIEIPPAGTIRAIDSQRVPTNGQYRNGIESAYQSALTFLATRSYDPASDMRDSDVPGEGSKGLTEAEKTLMETIIKDNGGVQSVTYQAVAGKAAPRPGEEGNSYLYGYTRTFEETASDLIEALKMGEFVIIGITDTDASGAIVGGHEITVTGAYVDKKDGELKFIVADSDDGVPSLVVRTARELIPRIHHAGMPLKLAQKINAEVAARQNYLIPDHSDSQNFNLMARNPEPMPMEQPPSETQPEPPKPAAPTPQPLGLPAVNTPRLPSIPVNSAPASLTQPVSPQIEWVPVYQNYPNAGLPAVMPTPQNPYTYSQGIPLTPFTSPYTPAITFAPPPPLQAPPPLPPLLPISPYGVPGTTQAQSFPPR